jgi:hypothetical protein
MTPTEPKTPQEWQRVVNIMSACLMIQDAIDYGVILVRQDAPIIDVGRCKSLIARGKTLGFLPESDAAQRLSIELLNQFS